MMPRGLLGRSLLIVLVPLVVVQAVALQVFYGTHLNIVSRRLSAAIAGEVALVIDGLARYPQDRDRILATVQERLELPMRLLPGTLEPEHARPPPLEVLEHSLLAALEERLRLPVALDWQADPSNVVLRVQMDDGLLEVDVPRKRLFAGTLYLFVLYLVGSSLLLFGIAALFMRNQVRGIRRLASAMDAFGRGHDAAALRPSGATEVRQAVAAFNVMQERVRRFMAQRTRMLAGVSHDLRTPLTRMRLGLAMLKLDEAHGQDLADLTADMEEMDRMIGGYLAFVRGVGAETAEPTELAPLLDEVARHARRAGAEVAVDCPEDLSLMLRAEAFRRAVTNLVDNARRHARQVAIGAHPLPGAVAITVDDDGPGIAHERRADVFRAFESGPGGGTGLGLTIALDVVRAHGGDITLGDSKLGGLCVRITVPT
ncbi:MAG: HAMP domain-containing protein [Acetobacteraceae bacterium]|nr:HAMP domain-containing protein [Acetobacteraceae bacterium]